MEKKKSRHSHTTLPHALGELELGVMEVVWQQPAVEARQVRERIGAVHPSSLSTIQTTLERLFRKGLLLREKRGHAFLYTACVSRGEMLGSLIKDVIHLLHDGKAETILSSFINVAARIDDAGLDRLEALIRQKRRQLAEEGEDA